jgi:hypothetical protein
MTQTMSWHQLALLLLLTHKWCSLLALMRRVQKPSTRSSS